MWQIILTTLMHDTGAWSSIWLVAFSLLIRHLQMYSILALFFLQIEPFFYNSYIEMV